MWPFTSTPASTPTPTPTSTPAQPPAVTTPADVAASADKCPVDHSARQAWLDASSNGNGDAGPSTPHPFHPAASAPASSSSSSGAGLSHHRVISSIPRGATSPVGPSQYPSEHAQPESSSSSSASAAAPGAAPASADTPGAVRDSAGNWVYPSEQQFFNAMMRKNHKPRAADMRTIVPIHNAVNEKAWEQILVWESKIEGSEKCGGPRLVSFVGKPKERTPKAWLKTAFGYTPPFDRHDWLVDRCGTQVRYVIDFYTGRAGAGDDAGKMSFYLDVRPAVDNWEGIKTRAAGFWS
ncbi:hypothetical protein IAT40_006513 [Kwoniella sp. CBS 6097]